jgi:hypothetical protein
MKRTDNLPTLFGYNEFCNCCFTNESPKTLFSIQKIGYKNAMHLIIQNHYLHRKAPCSFAFGLMCNKCKNIVGVITYGTPSSSTLRLLCGIEEKNNVIELTRLWVQDGTPKNTESFFIGNTINKVDKEIIVSFADSSQNHIGIVYQATNWLYTGLNAPGTQRFLDGKPITFQAYKDRQDVNKLKEIYGHRLTIGKRTRKYRYVYFNCNAKRKKQLLLKLKYPLLPYPKHITYEKNR